MSRYDVDIDSLGEVCAYQQGRADERERIISELEKLKEDSANYSDDDIFLGEYRAYKLAIEIVRGGDNETD